VNSTKPWNLKKLDQEVSNQFTSLEMCSAQSKTINFDRYQIDRIVESTYFRSSTLYILAPTLINSNVVVKMIYWQKKMMVVVVAVVGEPPAIAVVAPLLFCWLLCSFVATPAVGAELS
jgi:hypothetical protein